MIRTGWWGCLPLFSSSASTHVVPCVCVCLCPLFLTSLLLWLLDLLQSTWHMVFIRFITVTSFFCNIFLFFYQISDKLLFSPVKSHSNQIRAWRKILLLVSLKPSCRVILHLRFWLPTELHMCLPADLQTTLYAATFNLYLLSELMFTFQTGKKGRTRPIYC